jgi:predicted dehydrogenase
MRDVELVAVADVSAENREWAEKTLGVPAFTDYAELLAVVEAVTICMPDHLHEEVTVAALRSGVRVLLEKPMSVTSESCDRIIAAARDDRQLMIGHILRFDPRVLRARDLVASGALGEIWDVRVWRCTSEAVGAGIWDRTSVAWFLGIHDIDLVRFVTGQELDVLSAHGRSVRSQQADAVHAILRLSGGALVNLSTNWLLPHSRPSRADAGLRIVGEGGSVEIDLSHVDALFAERGAGANYLDTRFWPAGENTAFNLRSELEAFIASALADGPSPVSAEEGRAAVRVAEDVAAALSVSG